MNKVDLIKFSGLQKVFKPFFSGIGHVLVFHRVCNDDGSVFHRNLRVSPEYLEKVLRYFISNGIDIVSLDECYERITSRGRGKRFVTFTFDDGFIDNLTHALPVFEKYQVPLALFLTTGYPEHTIIFWGYLLEEFVLNHHEIRFSEGGEDFFFPALTMDEKKNAFYGIRKYLRESKPVNLFSSFKALTGKDSSELFEYSKTLMMSWEQVAEISRHPLVTIGAHTVTHNALSTLTREEVKKEIRESAELIERKTGKPVSYLAYPFGGDREAGMREFRLAEECNIKMAFTAKNGNVFRHHADRLTALPRIGLNENWSMSYIDMYVNGLIPFLDKF